DLRLDRRDTNLQLESRESLPAKADCIFHVFLGLSRSADKPERPNLPSDGAAEKVDRTHARYMSGQVEQCEVHGSERAGIAVQTGSNVSEQSLPVQRRLTDQAGLHVGLDDR